MRLGSKRDVYDATVFLKSGPNARLIYHEIHVHAYMGGCLEFRAVNGDINIVPTKLISSVRLIRRKKGDAT